LESGNVNAAWSWAVGKGCWRDVGRAAVGLRRLYVIGWGFREGRAAFEGAATRLRDIYGARPILTATQGYTRNAGKEPMLSASEATRVLLWLILSQFPFAQDAETWQQLFQQCEALLSDLELAGEDTRSEQADLAHHAASPTVWVVTMQEAREYARRALALDRELGNRRSMALTYGILGLQSYLLCDYEEARKYLEQELELACSLGDPRVSMDAMLWLTRSAICQGQVAEVEHWLSRLRPMVTGWGNRFEDDPLGLWLWGEAHLLSGRYVEASAALHECATRYRESEGRVYLGRMLPLLGMAYAHLGRYGQARVVAEEAVALNRETLSSGCVGSALCVLGDVALAEGQDKGAMALFEEAAGISRAGADRKRLAEALAHLAYGAWCLGREREARQNLAKAIRLGREVCSPLPLWAVLPACALLFAERGEPERAAELYAQAWSVPHIAHSHWYEDVAGHELAAVVADLPPTVREAALARGRAQELWDMAETLLAELEKKGA
jgi:tetratricopeptide (TPR) repeat protein